MVSLPQSCPACNAPIYNYTMSCGACGYRPEPLIDPRDATISALRADLAAAKEEAGRLREALGAIDKLLGSCVRLAESGNVKINPDSVAYQAAIIARAALEPKP